MEQPLWQKTFDRFIEIFIRNKKSLFLEKEGQEIKFYDGKEKIVPKCLELINGLTTMNGLHDMLKDKQNDENFEAFFSLLWHCYYIMYIMGPTSKKFLPNLKPNELKIKEKIDDTELFIKEYASTKQIFSSNPIRPFRCLLRLIDKLREEDLTPPKDVKEQIVEILLTKKDDFWKDGIEKDFDERIKNILIYLCYPDKYVPIISQTHKNNILKYLSFLIPETSQESDEERIKGIDDVLNNCPKQPQQDSNDPHRGNSFYDSLIRPFWDTPTISMNADKEGNLPLNTWVTFKKAIVLYGPPGTSKTYTAEELAKSVICTEFAKRMKETDESQNKKDKFEKFLKIEKGIFGEPIKSEEGSANQKVLSHIHRLQLHPNYSYDDFIVGKTIRNNDVDIQKGYLLNLIDEIEQDRNNKNSFANLPHIIILDEINRVDISRVFGELFKAMESDYRKDGVDLPASIITKKDGTKTDLLKLKVPADLYFIGTMNMIDFSLEQIDFALRRRFAWVESNYDKDRLKSIIDDKIKKKEITDLSSENVLIKSYISSCTALNDKISNQPNLGPAYKIGHTFFAEIIDIYGNEQFNVQDNKKWESAKDFLWHINIKPMIEAYCGTMDSKAQEDFIKQCKETFISSQNDNGNQ